MLNANRFILYFTEVKDYLSPLKPATLRYVSKIEYAFENMSRRLVGITVVECK